MQNLFKINSIFLCFFFLSSCALADLDSSIIHVSPKYCNHGLIEKKDSDFSIFVFCDDALGTQIGIILSRQGVGPVEKNTKWSNVNRFWQDGAWMTDIKEMVWSSSGNFLYVTTSEVYSDESFYEIDLRNMKAEKLYDGLAAKSHVDIESVSGKEISVNGRLFNIRD